MKYFKFLNNYYRFCSQSDCEENTMSENLQSTKKAVRCPAHTGGYDNTEQCKGNVRYLSDGPATCCKKCKTDDVKIITCEFCKLLSTRTPNRERETDDWEWSMRESKTITCRMCDVCFRTKLAEVHDDDDDPLPPELFRICPCSECLSVVIEPRRTFQKFPTEPIVDRAARKAKQKEFRDQRDKEKNF